MHPDVVEVEPEGTSYSPTADEVIEEAMRSPIEGERKVIILFEIENRNERRRANRLLKTFEEPPGRTVFVLTTSMPDDVLPTIRSRCQRIDFDAVADDTMRAALEGRGVRPTPPAAASLSGGQLARARAFAGRWPSSAPRSPKRPARVDGTGATALGSPSGSTPRSTRRVAEVARRHAEELAAFEADMERLRVRTARRSGCVAASRNARSAKLRARAAICCSKA